MKNEYSLVEIIARQITEEKKNYRDALLEGKQQKELKAIKEKINQLENSISLLQSYRNLKPSDLSIID